LEDKRMTKIGMLVMGVLAVLAIAGDPKREGTGGRGFDFGGLSQHDRPPLAKDDGEKKILGVLDEMSKGRWHLNVTTREGRFLRQVTESVGAKRVVEIGTSSGYSTLWLAMAVRGTGGQVITHDMDPKVLQIARENFKKAGVENLIEVVEGDAHETVKKLEGPIDVLFLDADKKGYIDYLEKLLPLVRPGGLVLGHDMNGSMPDPLYIDAITTNPNLDSSFVLMETYGISFTLRKR
jgi:predicted O-methyltransferase YrrM